MACVKCIAVGAIMAIACALIGPAVAQPFRSTYTNHDYERCRVLPVPENERDVVRERRCSGEAGIPVRWVSEPDASSVSFGREGLVGEFGEGFTFAVAGNRIEWRGPEAGGRIRPFAAIVRFHLCESVSGPCRPELVLFRLEGTRRSCLAARVNGRRADANERARALADETVRTFRCGVDQARAPE